MFHGHLFIAGPTALAEYDPDGSLIARYRAGAELPAAPLTALAVGSAGDSHGDELWIATSGEGVVAFDGRDFRQIRAEDAKFRKITALLPLATSRILIGTEKMGVLVYDGRELKPFHASLSDVPVTALAGMTRVYGSAPSTAACSTGTREPWNLSTMNCRIIRCFPLRKTAARVYAGTAMGVAEIRDGKFSQVLAPGYFAQSLFAADGRLWVGTLDEGMVEVPVAPRRCVSRSAPFTRSSASMATCLRSRRIRLWRGVAGSDSP